MVFDKKTLSPSETLEIDAKASVLIKRGIQLLGESGRDGVPEALACFDAARELRSGLPFETVPALRYGLAACWLNRAEALERRADETAIPLALHSYDEALSLLRTLPLTEDPRFPRRFAIAHQNRGLALFAQQGDAVAEAIAAFTDAIAVLESDAAALITDRQYLRATVWMNLANARASLSTVEADALARHAALRAIDLATDLEVNDAEAAEVGLKARHVLCRTIAKHLMRCSTTGQTQADDVHEATDVVDDGLGLVREWEKRGVARFRGLACDLLRFGARVYAAYQPQFLDEFVLENTDPRRSSPEYVESAEIRTAAQEALQLVDRNLP